MKMADEHNEARESKSGQFRDPIDSAVATERQRLMTDPLRHWCTQVLTNDCSAPSSGASPRSRTVSRLSLPGQTPRSVAAIHLSGFPATLSSEPIPRLDRITVRVAGSLPLMGGGKPAREHLATKYPPEPRIEQTATPRPGTGKTRSLGKAIVKVIPTREKRTRKKTEIEAAPAIVAVPKPLKIIRRRKEEEPKVFETGPRTVPRAMLEGVSESKDGDGNGQ